MFVEGKTKKMKEKSAFIKTNYNSNYKSSKSSLQRLALPKRRTFSKNGNEYETWHFSLMLSFAKKTLNKV